MAGLPLDRFISKQVLRALEPASLELSLQAAENIERQRRELDTLWQKRLERARYEVERTAREYRHVEPENRLVARELERAWEEKLRLQREIEEEHERYLRDQPRLLSPQEREVIRRLAADIPALWDSPLTTPKDKKEILRQVIDRVVMDVLGQSERVKLVIHWAGGIRTEHEMVRPVARLEQLSYWPRLQERIRELSAQDLKAPEITRILNEEGWRPPKRREKFGVQGIQAMLCRLGLRDRHSRSQDRAGLRENEWWIQPLARHLEMPAVTVYHWLYRGWVKARKTETGRLAIWADAVEVERLRQLKNAPRGHHARRHWTENDIGNELEESQG